MVSEGYSSPLNYSSKRIPEFKLTKAQKLNLKEHRNHYKKVLGYEPDIFFLEGDPYPTVDTPVVTVEDPLPSGPVAHESMDDDLVATPMDAMYGIREVTCSGHNNYRLIQKNTERNFCFTNGGVTREGRALYLSSNPKENIKGACPGIFKARYRYTWYSYGTEGQRYAHHTFSEWRSSSYTSKCWFNDGNVGHRVTGVFIDLK